MGPRLARLLPKSSAPLHCLTDVSRILLIRPGGIGDAVLLIPAIQALSVRYPHAKIEVLAENRNAAVFELCPQAEMVFCYDRWRDWKIFFPRRYDLIIDTEQWHYLSAIIARLLRAEVRCGFASNERRRLFSHAVGYSHDDYEVDSFAHLLAVVGVDMPALASRQFLLITPELSCRWRELLGAFADQEYIVIFPGASIPERRWPVVAFHDLARQCNKHGLAVVVVGGGEDVETGEGIIAGCNGVNLAGKTTLAETAAILSCAQLLVSGDSGVLHLASGVGCASVALFGPGIVNKWAPSGNKHRVVSLNLSCSPCTSFGTTPECHENGRCIKDISVDMVWQKVDDLLNR